MLIVRLLGPLAVEVDGEPVRLGSTKQKAILAQLALAAGRVVSVDTLVAGLWDDAPPSTAANAIQVHVSGLRKALGSAGPLIRTRAPGYQLDGAEVDAQRFERLVDEARQGRAAAWPEALDQWSAESSLVDLLDLPFAPAVATRLDELRLTVLEEFLERELAEGRAPAHVPTLSTLTERHPYRETFARLLMLALYRSGRQSDALATFRRTAQILADDMGIDPGPALTAMHAAILTQDPSLSPPSAEHQRPRPTGDLIGRGAEVQRVLDLVQTTRVVSLVGPGGVGKTRIAMELAELVQAEFVALSDVVTAEAALARIEGGGRTPLVLDNLEQIGDADALILGLLDSTERPIIVTSRSPLRLHAETVVNVAPLDLRDAQELFLAEAYRAGAVSAADGPAVTAICRRLDGLPLALVLAAARCRSMTPAQVRHRLEGDGLGAGPKDLPERHRTLRRTVEWSVDLLDPADRDVFADAAVFAAPFTLEAAAEVLHTDGLDALVDASLLIAEGGRLRMLETIRDCARSRLIASPSDAAARHSRWVLRRVAELAPHLNTAAEEDAINALTELLPEIRAATDYLADSAPDVAADVLVRTRRVWFVHGLLGEMRERLAQVSPFVTSERIAVEVAALQAVFARVTGDPGARTLLRDVLPALRGRSDVGEMLTNVLCHLAVVECEADDRETSTALAEEAVLVARGVGGSMLEMALDLSSFVARTNGDLNRAIEVAREEVEVGRMAPTLQFANALATLAHALADAGRHDEAAAAGLDAVTRVRSEFPIVRNEIVTEVANALGTRSPAAVVAALGEAISFAVAVGAWPMAAHGTCALTVIAAGVNDDALARLIAAVSRHHLESRFEALSAELRERLGADAWIEASRAGSILSADDVARLVHECVGATAQA